MMRPFSAPKMVRKRLKVGTSQAKDVAKTAAKTRGEKRSEKHGENRPHENSCLRFITILMDLLMGLSRRAIFHHGGVPENCPLALMGCFAP